MHFTGIKAANFRNFRFLEADLSGESHFIKGANGQGKTNLLEALGLVTSLRSFRSTDMASLIRWEAEPREAVLLYELEHETMGETRLEVRLRQGGKDIVLDGSPIRQLKDILGLFPTVTFSSHDIQLIRGGPSLRRRLMDMMFVVMDTRYFDYLTRYHKALRARNALLKQDAPANQRKAFESALVAEGYGLSCLRVELLEVFSRHFREAYNGISGIEEEPDLVYEPSIKSGDAESYEQAFLSSSRRDRDFRTTHRGPHRDDLAIRLQAHPAKAFASEGQQRGLVLALRMGLVRWYREQGGAHPVILADDIVGELDPCRKEGFWRTLGTDCQLVATGTLYPTGDSGQKWTRWSMDNGDILHEAESDR